MGYRSSVRIRLTKKDFEQLKIDYEPIATKVGHNILDDNNVDMYREIKDFNVYDSDSDRLEDCIYFGWDWIKWYPEFEDVAFIENFVKSRKCYAFCRIGEDDTDIETSNNGMDCIGFYYVFDEDDCE